MLVVSAFGLGHPGAKFGGYAVPPAHLLLRAPYGLACCLRAIRLRLLLVILVDLERQEVVLARVLRVIAIQLFERLGGLS